MPVTARAHSPVFYLPGTRRNGKPTRKELENPNPPEFRHGTNRVTENEILKLSFQRQGKTYEATSLKGKYDDNEKWINRLFNEKALYGKYITRMQNLDYTYDEAKEIIDGAILQSERVADWAIDVEKRGNIAAGASIASGVLSIASDILQNHELLSPNVRRVVSTLSGISRAVRYYEQYQMYCGREDDDKAKNKHEANEYGDKLNGIFADLAGTFGTTLFPLSDVVLGLINDEKLKEILSPLMLLPIQEWWRIRPLSEINHEFSTDLFDYLKHKPLALLQVEESIKKIKELKDRGNLTPDYIKTRLIELIGLDPDTNRFSDIYPELSKQITNIFGKDKLEARDSSLKLSRFIGPIFGFYGLVALTLGTPIRSILKWLNIESKFLNSLTQSGIASQQLLYLFKFIIPEQFENQIIDYSKLNPELQKLQPERDKLFYTGLAECTLNIFSVFLRSLNTENKYLKTGLNIYDELAEKGVLYYFSRRRTLMAKKFKLDNPELFNPNETVRVISKELGIREPGVILFTCA